MISKSQRKYLNSLLHKKYRYQYGQFLIEGEKIVRESLESLQVIRSLFITELFLEKYRSLIEQKGVAYQIVKPDDLKQSGSLVTNAQALGIMDIFTEPLEKRKEGEYLLALDNIQDPGNLGSILRIADWYGISRIVCSKNTVDFYNPKVIAASMGSFLRVKMNYLDLKQYLQNQPETKAYAAILGAKNLHKIEFSTQGGILILGNESKGISEAIKTLPLEKISIPSFGPAESLNVAMATAVICDNLRRQVPPL